MDYLPIFLKLREARVLVVGGGEVALRKIRLLSRAGARVEVAAPEVLPEILTLPGVERVGSRFEPWRVAGCRLVVAATDDAALNRAVAAAADAANVPVNVVDDPTPSSFITPSIVDRDPVLVAISTGGAAPVLARRLREKLESQIPESTGRLARFMQVQRERIKALPQALRRRVWEKFLDGAGSEAAMRGDDESAQAAIQDLIAGRPAKGEVYLVGAGPGDPDLLTFRALRLMQQADVVLYDRLVSKAILERVRRDAERVFVGKGPKQHEYSQEEINALLVKLAKEGKRVLRLKGGDPFIFGRGGEEIETLSANGVAFQVVPGITAANGCAAYAGIPLTHRDHAQACVFVTGHAQKDGTLKLNWDALAQRGQTVVIYMGLTSLPQLCAKLIEHGLPREWPIALIEEGTSETQQVITGVLGDLPQKVEAAKVKGASLVIVGEVVKLRERLNWYR
ncbi:MAG: siroheme synthase CysG [Pseudomonadota bacterium]